MTYFKEEPRDPLYKLRRKSGNAEDLKALSHVVTNDKQEKADIEKRKKLQKGFIDLSTVIEIDQRLTNRIAPTIPSKSKLHRVYGSWPRNRRASWPRAEYTVPLG